MTNEVKLSSAQTGPKMAPVSAPSSTPTPAPTPMRASVPAPAKASTDPTPDVGGVVNVAPKAEENTPASKPVPVPTPKHYTSLPQSTINEMEAGRKAIYRRQGIGRRHSDDPPTE